VRDLGPLFQQLKPLTGRCAAVQALYVHTSKNVLIQISPHVRLPRTFKRFCGLMVQLLQKMSIRATNGPDKLLKVGAACPRPLFPPFPGLQISRQPALCGAGWGGGAGLCSAAGWGERPCVVEVGKRDPAQSGRGEGDPAQSGRGEQDPAQSGRGEVDPAHLGRGSRALLIWSGS
jgi:EMG1/NEP1 methyltransferase